MKLFHIVIAKNRVAADAGIRRLHYQQQFNRSFQSPSELAGLIVLVYFTLLLCLVNKLKLLKRTDVS